MKYLSTMLAALFTLVLLVAPALGQESTDAATRIKDLELKIELLAKEKAAATVAPVPAQNTADLEKRIKELEQKIEQLVKAQELPTLKLMNNEEQERAIEPVGLTGFYDNGYLVASSKDGAFKYWLDGRANLDFATYAGAKNRLPTAAEVRRARIGVKATLFTNWLTEIDVDFADNFIEMKDVWVGYAGFANSLIKVGNHKAPFGLETLTTSKNIIFMERSYLDSWSPDRLLGINYSRWGKFYQLSAGLYGEAGGAFNDKDTLTGGGTGSSQGWSLVGRFTAAPVNRKGRVLHLGVAAAHRNPDAAAIATSGATLPDRLNASRLIKFDSRAESHVSRAKFISTGDMKFVDNYNQIGAELAGVLGPVTFQAEYQKSMVNRVSTTVATYVDHSFSGYYGSVSWFVTGERRLYSVSEGEFGRVVPTRSAGAVEVGLRFSALDLSDETAVDPIKGGGAKNATLGVTWFMNVNHKLMFNVTMVNNDALAKPGKDWAPLPAGTSTTQIPIFGDDFTTIAVRYQIAF